MKPKDGDVWDDQRAINYLQNFWEPQIGSQMLCDGNLAAINYIEDDYPEQVSLVGDNSIHYIQDLNWFPKLHEVYPIFEKLGIKISKDAVAYNHVFKPLPTNLIEAAKSLVDLRSYSLLSGDAIKV